MLRKMIQPAIRPFNTFVRYRWLIQELVTRDLKLRYRGSALGFTWTLLNPLLFMAIYSLVFSVYLRMSIVHYPLFLLSGLLPWNWFAGALQQGTSVIIEGRMYVGKTIFPAEVLVIVPVLSHFINLVMALPLLIVLAVWFHVQLGAPLLVLPFLLFVQMLLTTGFLYFAATVNVFFRDFQQLVTYLIMFLFYLTPIFYSVSFVPSNLVRIVMSSPFAILAIGYQDIFYYNVMPDATRLFYLALFSIILFIAGRLTLDRYQDSFGEYL